MSTTDNLVILVVSVVVSTILVALTIAFGARKKTLQSLGIQWLQAMRMMLMHLQLHRGLSSAYLAGDVASKPKIDSVRTQISSDICNISSIGEWVNNNQNWLGITQHWARLSAGNLGADQEKNFNQHCRLIGSVLAMLDETAQQHLLENKSRYGNIKFIWHELLYLAELIGQTRALGVQQLSLRKQSHLLNKNRVMIQKSLVEIEELMSQPACQRKITGKDSQSIFGFIEYVKIHLVDNLGQLSVSEYFILASNTMEVIYECFDQEIQKLQRKVKY